MADKLLFVISAAGGASVVDSFMAVKESEVTTAGGDASALLCYPDAFVHEDPATGLRALDLPDSHRLFLGEGVGAGSPYRQSTFLQKYKDHLSVMALENTSVNHFVAEKRSLNGFGINRERTLLEAVADRYGQSLLLPNVNMSAGGFLDEGKDDSLPAHARQEVVADARFFSLSTDGLRGLIGTPGTDVLAAPTSSTSLARARALMARARGVREQLDDVSTFGKTFQCSPLRQKLLERRRGVALSMEAESLISNLTLLAENDLPDIVGLPPLSTYGLAPTPDTEEVRRHFDPEGLGDFEPGTRIFVDGFLAQAVLAFLLARFGLTCGTAFGPRLIADVNTINVNPPLSFDFSHNNHPATQAVMWSRVLDVADKLISLLQATDAGDGTTMWDRSTVYIATDFGRDKARNFAGQDMATEPVSTSHHLNNGVVMLSPKIRGGVYGGVDARTLLTYGFDRQSGAPVPGSVMREGDVYSAVCQSLDIEFAERIALPCMRR